MAKIRTQKGLYLRNNWVEEIVKENPTLMSEDSLFAFVLNRDLSTCSSGYPNPASSDSASYNIKDSIVFQVQSIVNIAAPTDSQFVDTSNRMLKLKLTDGKHEYFAIEHGTIPSLSVTLKPGVKIAVSNVRVEKGLLLLNTTNTSVLGGSC